MNASWSEYVNKWKFKVFLIPTVSPIGFVTMISKLISMILIFFIYTVEKHSEFALDITVHIVRGYPDVPGNS